jgi:glycosyltransferase involved in cell wall biosynthesis/O-antigen ligase
MSTKVNLRSIHFYSTCSLALFPLMPPAPMSIIVIVWAIVSFLAILTEGQRPRHRSAVMMWLFASLYIFYGLSLVYSSNMADGLDRLGRMSPLLLFPVLSYFLPYNYGRKQVEIFLKLFVYGLILTVVLALIHMLYDGFLDALTASRNPVTFTRIQLETYTNLHPSYLSLFLSFALLISTNGLQKKQLAHRILTGVMLLFILTLIFILSAKMSIVALGVTALWVGFKSSQKKYVKFSFIFASLSIVLLLIAAIPTTRERFSDFLSALTKETVDKKNPDSVRKGIYTSAIAVILEHPVCGTGIGDANDALKKQYKRARLRKAFRMNFNSHNQYLDIWISAGIFPVFLFVLALGLAFYLSQVNKNREQAVFIMLMAACLLTENMLSRQAGVLFFSFFNALFVFQRPTNAMQICINGRFLTQRTSGVQRFAREVSRKLRSANKDYLLLSPSVGSSEKNDFPGITIRPFSSHLWEQITLPFFCSIRGNPILLNMGNTAPIMYGNSVVVIHDLSVYENPRWFKMLFRKMYMWVLPLLVRRAKAIITVSEFSARQIRNRFPKVAHKIHVCYNGIPSSLHTNAYSNDSLINDPFVFTVGSSDPRKNLKTLVDAYVASGITQKLVIAGNFNAKIFNSADFIDPSSFQAEKVTFIDSPDDRVLLRLYQTADAFIFIPYYEGFGLPVLEALSAGCPVIASDIEVFRELYEGAALFTDPTNVNDVAVALQRLTSDPSMRESLISSGRLKTSKYSYSDTANTISAIFKQLNSDGSATTHH